MEDAACRLDEQLMIPRSLNAARPPRHPDQVSISGGLSGFSGPGVRERVLPVICAMNHARRPVSDESNHDLPSHCHFAQSNPVPKSASCTLGLLGLVEAL